MQEVSQIRFEYNMNLLQLVCHEEAVQILNYLIIMLDAEVYLKETLVNNRDSHLGS